MPTTTPLARSRRAGLDAAVRQRLVDAALGADASPAARSQFLRQRRSIGPRLAELLGALNLRPVELAVLCDLRVSEVYYLLRGSRYPRFATVEAIAAGLRAHTGRAFVAADVWRPPSADGAPVALPPYVDAARAS